MTAPLRIVVLGGTGFVGSQVVPRLHADGHAVTVLSRNRERHRELGVLPRVRIVNTDVYDAATLRSRLAGADVAINLVGILNERGRDGRGFERAHVALTRGLVDACRASGVSRLLQMSALNSGRGTSHYLRTRGAADAVVQRSGLDWTIFRPSVIFGPHDGLYFRFARLVAALPMLPLARAGARFAPVYVGDVAEAFARCVADPATIGETLDLVGPRVMPLREIVTDAMRWSGNDRLVVPLPDVLARVQAAVMDFVPGKPFSSDNYRTLLLDAVGADGLRTLGIAATPVEAIMPALLGGAMGAARPRY